MSPDRSQTSDIMRLSALGYKGTSGFARIYAREELFVFAAPSQLQTHL